MKITLETTKKTKQTFDVEFPIYRRQDVGGDTYESYIYSRIDRLEDRSMIESSVKIYSTPYNEEETAELTFDPGYRFSESGADYNLGLGEYACTKEWFDEAVRKAKELLRKIEGVK